MEGLSVDKKVDEKPRATSCAWPIFTAISNVMFQAKRARLEPEDLLQIPASDNVVEQAQFLKVSWERTLRQFHRDQAAKKAEALANPEAAKKKKKKKGEELPSLTKALWPQVRGLWRIAFWLYLVSVGLAFLGPFLLGRTVQLLTTTQQCGLKEQAALNQLALESGQLVSNEPPTISDACRESSNIYMGYIFAAAMLCVKLVEALLRSWHDHLMTRLALRARAAIIATIYRKCLWLSGMGAGDTTTGRIQNLMANDAQFFLQIAPMFNNLFVAPIQILVCFTWLGWLIGPSFLAGVLALLVSVPCQATILKVYFRCQIARLKMTDQRIKLTNEMVQGMRVVKMYAWEQTIGAKLAEVRKQELLLVRKQRFMSAFLSVFMSTQPLFLTVSTFSVYAASGRPLEANIVLPALALLSLLRMPIAFLPMILMQLANLKVAIGRITKFLMNEELSDEIKARCLETEALGERSPGSPAPPAALSTAFGEILSETPGTGVAMSSLLQNASEAATAAIELVSSTLAADDLSEDSVRPHAKVVKAVPATAMRALAEEMNTIADEMITIEGTFRWQKVEVDAGKGKGKGGGGRGGGGRGGGGGAASAPAPPKRSLTRRLTGRWAFTAGRSASPDAARTSTSTASAETTTKEGATAEAEPQSPSGKGGRGRGTAAAPPVAEVDEKKATPSTLHRLSVSFPHAQLTMVAGAVGCGKSSLLCALLGELRAVDDADEDGGIEESTVRRAPGAVGYFAQTPFILNATLRDNILLGAPMDEAWYQNVLSACALLPDLKILPGGDMTQIGEKGINLSGGQKARVALARACYARARVLILDDPLSAVDAHVGRHIFREVLGPAGLLAGTTRILVTHQTQYLPLADKVVLLEQGAVLAQGSFAELQASELDLSAISSLGDGTSYTPTDLAALLGTHDEATDGPKPVPEAPLSPLKDVRSATVRTGDKTKDNAGAMLIKDEERATGSVSWAIHLEYVRAMGGVLSLCLLVLATAADKFVAVATDYWLALWIDPSSSSLGEYTPDQDVFEFWIPIYVGGVLVTGVLVYFRAVFFNVAMGLRAARIIYARLSASVLAAPMLFFETTPSGRILNRFTSDTEQVDFALLMTLAQWTNCISSVIGALVLICTVNPWFLCVLPAFAGVYSTAYYISSSATRDLQRLEAVTRSPIFTQFSETLNGLSTIRAFGRTAQFERASLALVAANTRCFFNQDMAAQWISQRLDFCSACIAGITVLLPTLVLQFGSSLSSSPAAFGLCITYALDLSAFLKFGTKMTLDIQRGMAAVERILEYADSTPTEPTGGLPVPFVSWPSAGRIVTRDLCVRYRPELPLALRGVSCTIEPCAKVGIVGRTGSGKTTFVSALWRLVEPTRGEGGDGKGGAIEIDGVDLSQLQLHALRSRLAIIVQDPVLFNASVRYNLDPFGEHSDVDVKKVVNLAQLDAAVAALPDGIESPVGEAGANFSVGQRQLICLARAMLRRSKLVVLDEATASIDNETDAILQSTIREVFADATVLTIAHRLHTIMDSTQVMVFDQGELKEFDPPPVLLEDEQSLFSKLVADTGSAATHLRTLAAEGAAARAAPQ